LQAAVQEEATLGVWDAYGQRYVLDFLMKGPLGTAKVRSSWIVLTGENFPRLTSCYVIFGDWLMDPKLLDVVALLEDIPAQKLVRGQVGTVVEGLAPGVFEVEFSDSEGRTYASAALPSRQLLVLHHKLFTAA